MIPNLGISGIAHAIQLAVAPVFLLSGVGGMLAVITNRLARIVDRARDLERSAIGDDESATNARSELMLIARRGRLVSWSIALCTTAALMIASVIATMFLGAFFGFDASTAVAVLFIIAMLAMIAALALFLREVFLATATLRFTGATFRELSRRPPNPR